MALERAAIIPSLVALVVLCLFITGMYRRYGGNLDLMISRRSLEKENITGHTEIKFPNNYHATGRLFLPHSNIVEPFEIWFTSDFNRSRIDYYYGRCLYSDNFIWHIKKCSPLGNCVCFLNSVMCTLT